MPDNDTSLPSPAPEQPMTEAQSQPSSVDLSVLKNISFGPDWSATPSTEAIVRKVGGRSGKRGDWEARDSGGRPGGGDGRRDRRPTRPPGGGSNFGGGGAGTATAAPRPERPRYPTGQPGGDRGPRREGGYGERRDTPPMFRPTLDVLFYPDDAAFRALTKAIRASCRT